ncbi:hypothetical protein BpHYR1_039186 [Brachionus plicatilis]|uniref:Uncharacterized protein n=1 Tax=Brachionus plicatilis TaxID=10195 RepID=A0A3M7QZH9_BRAPC|nr:hypothetical protein BpHYR1_039186 [Brachionus plicatilis]
MINSKNTNADLSREGIWVFWIVEKERVGKVLGEQKFLNHANAKFIPEEIGNYSKNKSKYYLGLYRINPNFDIVPRGVVPSFRLNEGRTKCARA